MSKSHRFPTHSSRETWSPKSNQTLVPWDSSLSLMPKSLLGMGNFTVGDQTQQVQTSLLKEGLINDNRFATKLTSPCTDLLKSVITRSNKVHGRAHYSFTRALLLRASSETHHIEKCAIHYYNKCHTWLRVLRYPTQFYYPHSTTVTGFNILLRICCCIPPMG